MDDTTGRPEGAEGRGLTFRVSEDSARNPRTRRAIEEVGATLPQQEREEFRNQLPSEDREDTSSR